MMSIDCIRKACIEDPKDPYHFEEHLCYVCGAAWDPVLSEAPVCEQCGWLKCPACGGCKCSLSGHDRQWLDDIRSTLCQDVRLLAGVRVASLPDTDNPHLREGMSLQLRFCRRWALEQCSRPAQQ